MCGSIEVRVDGMGLLSIWIFLLFVDVSFSSM